MGGSRKPGVTNETGRKAVGSCLVYCLNIIDYQFGFWSIRLLAFSSCSGIGQR